MYKAVAKKKSEKTIVRLIIEGIMAGFFIACGAYASQLATVNGHPKAVAAAIFPAGLIMVVLTGCELFTGNCLLAGSVAAGDIGAKDMLRVWIFSYIGNIIGALLMYLLVSISGMSPEHREIAEAAAQAKLSLTAPQIITRGILCNILVCVAVWTAIHAQDTAGKVLVTFIPVFIFVYCGFEHSVANMFYLPLGGAPAWAAIVQIALATAGNIIGGAVTGILLEKR